MTFRQKISLLAVAPLIIVTVAVTLLLTWQSTRLARSNIGTFQENMLRSKKVEITDLTQVALSAIQSIYHNASADDPEAKARVAEILSALDFGADGYFFVYDFEGNNIVHPREVFRHGKNWIGLVDPDGDRVIRELIRTARAGGGFHQYKWQKPSTGTVADKISYVVELPKWKWVLGTGAYLDDVFAQTGAATAIMEERTRESFLSVAIFAVPAVLIVFSTCLYVTFDERKLADGILKQLTQRVFDSQETERSRLARELHDGVSQELLGVRFVMERAARQASGAGSDVRGDIEESVEALNSTIREIRSISHDLRPRVLDDMGLVAAMNHLLEKFGARTGLEFSFQTAEFVDDLLPAVRTAIFRVAQEALSNIERHSGASRITIRMWTERGRARIEISDNGRGLGIGPASSTVEGLGLQNMRERIAHHRGKFFINGDIAGTKILIILPKSAAVVISSGERAA